MVSLRKKTLLLMGITLGITLVAAAFLAQTHFLEGYRRLEERDIKADLARFKHALEFERNRLSVLTYDWSAWDDTYQFMQDSNPEYISSNLMHDTLENLDLNFMIYFSTDRSIHTIKTNEPEKKDMLITPADLDRFFLYNPNLTASDDPESDVSGIVSISGKPVLISARPILTSNGEGPPRGCLVFGKILTGHLLEHLHDMTGQDITIHPLDRSTLDPNLARELILMDPEDAMILQTRGLDAIEAFTLVRDIQHHPAFIVEIEKPRSIYQQGRETMLTLGFSLASTGIIASIMALFILNREVISRLFSLNAAVQEIRTNGYSGQSLVIPGNDEITALSIEIEGSYKELADAQTDINNHLNIQRLLFKMLTELINVPVEKIDTHIQTTLQTIGKLAGADRCYVFLRRENEPHIIDNTHEWCRKGILPMKDTLQGIQESSLPWLFKQLNQREKVLISCVDDLPESARAEREMLQIQSIKSLAIVPMLVGGNLMGFLGFDAVKKQKKFSERSLALLGIIGGMIANAIDRQQSENKLARSQQVQYQLNQITQASIEKNDLRSAALALSRNLRALIHSDRGILVLFNSEGEVDIFDSGRRINLPQVTSDEWLSFIKTQQEFIFINTNSNGHELPVFAEYLKTRAFILIPLVSRREILGAVILADNKARVYSPEDAAICQQAGPQITLSILKVRALESAQRRSLELDALRATITDITSELQLEKLLRTALERAIKLAHADAGEVSVFNEEKQALKVVASLNLDKDYTGIWMSVGEGAGGKAVALKRTFMVKDYATWPDRMQAYQGSTFHATIVSPLMIGSRVLGTISILHFDPQRQFSKDDQYILSLFAQHAAIAMENALLFEKVEDLARTDAVTGLLNRRALREIGEDEVKRARRLGLPIAVAMIDLDDFKLINDTYSHQVGDDVLRAVSRLFRENIRNIDTVSRFGGDEFVIVMPATNLEDALLATQRLKNILNTIPVKVDGREFLISASIGITSHAEQPPELDELLQQADEAMYAAKNSGKDRIRVYGQ